MEKYVEMTLEEAQKLCNKYTKVLVAVTDLEKSEVSSFIPTYPSGYGDLFKDAKTIAAMYDEFINQLSVYTEKQDIHNILPIGLQKSILLKNKW